jgi:hypothetical protein
MIQSKDYNVAVSEHYQDFLLGVIGYYQSLLSRITALTDVDTEEINRIKLETLQDVTKEKND